MLASDLSLYLPSSSSSTCAVALNYPTGTTKPSTAKVSGNLAPTYNKFIKGFNLTDLLFIVKSPDILSIKLTCSDIKIPISGSSSYDTSYFYPLTISMRSCKII